MEDSNEALVKRGQLLLDQGRHEEAEDYFKQALALEPDDAFALYGLALSQYQQEKGEGRALDSIDAAIRQIPDFSGFHATRSMVLCGLKRYKDAHVAADTAMELDPDDEGPIASKAQVYAHEAKWAKAEEYARKSLSIDGDDEMAQNVLTNALLMQGKEEENRGSVDRQLRENPDSEMAHLNAGYAALRRMDHATAEEHFREALRLDASWEPAREGMLESLRARSIFYRGYLRYCFWMGKFTAPMRLGLMVGMYLLYRMIQSSVADRAPALGLLIMIAWVLFALWTHVARGVGNMIILSDKGGRMVLKDREQLEGILVGGGILVGLALAVPSAFLGYDFPLTLGLLFLSAGISFAAVFRSGSKDGMLLYGGLTAAIIIAAVIVVVSVFSPGTVGEQLVSQAQAVWKFAFIAVIWMSAFGVKQG